MLLARFSEFDRDEQGFIAADRLRELLSSLGDEFGELPSEDELRKQMDPDGLSLITWDAFQRHLKPRHPAAIQAAAAAAAAARMAEAAGGEAAQAAREVAAAAVGASAAEEAARAAAQLEASHAAAAAAAASGGALTLYHYNGLATRGHEHKRVLSELKVTPGAARGMPVDSRGIAAVVRTRWHDASVEWEGQEPSIS